MSRDQGPTDCCNGRCNQGRACIMRTENGSMTDGLPITMYEPAQPWDWIDRMLTAVMRNCVRVVLFCLAAGLVAGFLSAFFKI